MTQPPPEDRPSEPQPSTSSLPPYPGSDPRGPAPYGHQPVPSQTRATTGLVLCIVPTVITAIIGLVLCIMVLSDRRDPRNGGRGKAIAGLIVVGVYIVLTVLLVLVLVVVGAVSQETTDRSPSDEPTSQTDTTITYLSDVRTGDCLRDELPERNILTVDVVPCERRHHGEVVGSYLLPRGEWPGASRVDDLASSRCRELADQRATDEAAETLDLYYFTPSEQRWPNDRRVQCVLEGEDARRGSVTDSGT